MPGEARLFASSAGSVVRGYLKFRVNIPPRWIRNARRSRKRIEPEVAEGFRSLKRLRIGRPRARVAIRNAQSELRLILDRWETAYRKENFYRPSPVRPELPNQQRPQATRSCLGSRDASLIASSAAALRMLALFRHHPRRWRRNRNIQFVDRPER
jgi:hypothetical protein